MTNFYSTIQFFVWKIYGFLQETVYPCIWPVSKAIEPLDLKRNRVNLSSKHVTTDLLFLVICVFMVVLTILTLKCVKDEEDELEEDENEVQYIPATSMRYNKMSDSLENSVCSNPQEYVRYKDDQYKDDQYNDDQYTDDPYDDDEYNDAQCNSDSFARRRSHGSIISINPETQNVCTTDPAPSTASSGWSGSWGDAPTFSPEKQPIPRKLRSSTYSLKEQCQQPNPDWFLKRTRSGQIYGRNQE